MLRKPCSILLAAAFLAGCGHDHPEDLDAVYLDEASDEVLLTFVDAVDRGEVTVNDVRAARLTAPADGAELPAGTPATFTWGPADTTVFHGVSTGDFVWLRLECDGMASPIDVFGIDTMTWTADADHWAKLSGSEGECTATVTSAYVDRGIIEEGGPFQPTLAPTFHITQ